MKYINAVAFVFGDLASTLHDRVLSGIAEAATIARAKWLGGIDISNKTMKTAWTRTILGPKHNLARR